MKTIIFIQLLLLLWLSPMAQHKTVKKDTIIAANDWFHTYVLETEPRFSYGSNRLPTLLKADSGAVMSKDSVIKIWYVWTGNRWLRLTKK